MIPSLLIEVYSPASSVCGCIHTYLTGFMSYYISNYNGKPFYSQTDTKLSIFYLNPIDEFKSDDMPEMLPV